MEGICAEGEQADVEKTMLDKQVLCNTVKGMDMGREEVDAKEVEAKETMLVGAEGVELCEWQRDSKDVCIWELKMQ